MYQTFLPRARVPIRHHRGYKDPGFWAPALSEAERRAEAEAGADWAVGDVANCALLGARVAMKAPAKLEEPKAGENMGNEGDGFMMVHGSI